MRGSAVVAAPRRPLRAAPPRVLRALVALALDHRERAIVLDALGVPGALAWREGRSLEGLLEHAALVDGGLELLEAVLRGELAAKAAPAARGSAALVVAWEEAREGSPRAAAALLFGVATSEGWLMRRLEQRMLEDLDARLWRVVCAVRPRGRAFVPARAAVLETVR